MSDEFVPQVIADGQASDALLLGRTTYDIFRDYWPGRSDEIGQAFDRVPNHVASRGTPTLSWDRRIPVTDVGVEVRGRRDQHEQIHTWGSANLLQTLLRESLVDQLSLWVYPIVIGQGKKLLPDGTAASRFEQLEPPRSYPGGAILLRYRLLADPPERRGEWRSPNVAGSPSSARRPGVQRAAGPSHPP